jgi:hypothetical protein
VEEQVVLPLPQREKHDSLRLDLRYGITRFVDYQSRCCCPAPKTGGPYETLLKHVTANTNTLALIDVKGALTSPLAKKEKWMEKGQHGNRDGLGFVPADAEQVVIASEINLTTLNRDFQVGLVKVRNTPTTREFLAREGGTTDEIAERPLALSSRGVYFTTLSASELAVVYPADRQYTARWLKGALAAKSTPLSGYLLRAAEKAGENTVTIAVDLEDVVDKTILKTSLAASPTIVKHKTPDIGLLATLMASVKGLTFSAKVGDTITGSLVLEFRNDPTSYRKTLPELFLELLDGQGVWIEGMDKWEVSFTETTMSFSGPLKTGDLKEVLSLFAFPHVGDHEQVVKPGEISVPLTRRYMEAVDTILTDVSRQKDSPNYVKTATWHEKAAAQVENLSRHGVDPLAVDGADRVAKRLRAIASSLRGVPIDMNALASQQYYFANPIVVPGGWWGWRPYIASANVDTNIPKIQAEMAKVIADDQKRRLETWSQIERIMNDTRKTLVEKYKGF